MARGETSTHWIFMGSTRTLNEAMKIAVRGTIDFLAEQKMVPMSREEAYALTSIVGDLPRLRGCGHSQGVHCTGAEVIFVKK